MTLSVKLYRVAPIVGLLACLIFLTPGNSAADPKAMSASDILGRELPSSEGKPFSLRSQLGKRATVLAFLNSECPISNGYIPTLNELSQKYAEQGVAVVGVNSNDGVSLRQIILHAKEFSIAFPVLRDAGGLIADQFAAGHCPEVIVLDAKQAVQYRGRIDDRYSRRGGKSREIRKNDLSLAIEEMLAGKPVSVAKTEVVGCPILRPATKPVANRDARTSRVTYADHVGPLLQKHCQSCHRPGGIGPFSLLTFEQAQSWADDLKNFTANRQMPPWLPEHGIGDFHNLRVMSDSEIALVGKWVDEGCVAGDLSQLAPAPTFKEGWTIGDPDLIIQPTEPFALPADGKDVYHCFVIPTDHNVDRYVSAIEVRPGNPRVVHHVLVYVDTTGRSLQLDSEWPGQGYATSAGSPGFLPAGGMGGWAPGNQPQRLPDGMARVLPAKAKLVVQVHYHPSGKPEVDQTMIGLHFAKGPVTRTARVLPVMPFGGPWSSMRIPAGDAHAEVKCSTVVPRDSLALTVTPHMHLLGKDMRLTATLPDGTVKPLIFIPRWDFNWQESYQYREPVSLPKGTRLDLVAHYDNSANNPSNPNSPPREVRWGEQTSSEMCIAFLLLVPAEPAKGPDDLKAPSPGELWKESLIARFQTSGNQWLAPQWSK